ncbi:Uncharacterised protein [BD1-7 clade bacterium]|uniref:Uncharacterized protein n=1 Tax=BD1-7 clade bacterium TaxID=2029982 RepID=A0A5S9QXL4_9GAMM|nr:Uncharacterised protein [BD1-7 clade bacterium]
MMQKSRLLCRQKGGKLLSHISYLSTSYKQGVDEVQKPNNALIDPIANVTDSSVDGVESEVQR